MWGHGASGRGTTNLSHEANNAKIFSVSLFGKRYVHPYLRKIIGPQNFFSVFRGLTLQSKHPWQRKF
jgi:hypothetical protein